MKLKDKVAIITGGGRGIGRAIAEACSREGARVAITSRTSSELQETAALLRNAGGEVEPIVSDVTDHLSVSDALRSVLVRWGRVDLLVNNAGTFRAIGPAWETDVGKWLGDVQTNLIGTHLWCRAVIPPMLERRSGTIITMIGGGTFGPFEYGSAYGVSKAAIMRYTETLAVELDRGIAVFAVNPGLVRTQMVEQIMGDESGRRWFGWMQSMLDEHTDTPAAAGAALVVELATGRHNGLTGRAVHHDDDLTELMQRVRSDVKPDLRTLRMVE